MRDEYTKGERTVQEDDNVRKAEDENPRERWERTVGEDENPRERWKRTVDIHLLFLGTISGYERRIYPRREDVARRRQCEKGGGRESERTAEEDENPREQWERIVGEDCRYTPYISRHNQRV